MVVHNNLAYEWSTSWDDTSSSLIKGKLGGELNVEIGQKAARRCVLSGLSVLLDALGDLQIINRVIKISVLLPLLPVSTNNLWSLMQRPIFSGTFWRKWATR